MSSAAATTARAVTTSTIATGRSQDRNVKSLFFLGALWFSLFFGVTVLFALIVDTAIDGSRPVRRRTAHALHPDVRPGTR